ncbi:MAG TPA: nuclear transport factor 2 family protein [Candidatus Sulfotelmatobacter sp.]|nr:nuclear transport factor 2 family protein [Candidatus Sulfotelmatobacter sp.]
MYRPYSSSSPDVRPPYDAESQIRNLTQDFATSFNKGNHDQAAGMFATDGVLMVPNHEAAYGPKAVERLLRQISDKQFSSLHLETMRVERSGEMAMEIGRFSAVSRSADGTTVSEHGKYVRVWRRLGAWLVIADCWSRTLEAACDRAA